MVGAGLGERESLMFSSCSSTDKDTSVIDLLVWVIYLSLCVWTALTTASPHAYTVSPPVGVPMATRSIAMTAAVEDMENGSL